MYFIIYSVILFVITDVYLLSIKTPLYFLIGFSLSGILAALFMITQHKIETDLNPNFWILNIAIEVIGYYIYTHTLFYLFYLI